MTRSVRPTLSPWHGVGSRTPAALPFTGRSRRAPTTPQLPTTQRNG